ncbi:MAG TPA: hypothetical protein VKQ52_11760, partial [Puia sp.]|nr:hypothetical protein [Puia sp.]
ATAALLGNRLLNKPTGAGYTENPPLHPNELTPHNLAFFAACQYSWILGCNPYSMCFLYGWGKNNVPYMHSNYGHGSQRGGISNGITGEKDHGDGSGIEFLTSDNGNEWRWTEQWLPHAAWFLDAVTAMNRP